jgi:hypothetical protein
VPHGDVELTNIALWNMALAGIFISWLLASALALRIKKLSPTLHQALGSPSWGDWWPFWTFNFLRRSNLFSLSIGLRIMAVSSMLGLGLGLGAFALSAIRFVQRGASF